MHLRLGSRGSQLALWQANHIAAHLRELGHTTEILIIRTTGDRMQDPTFTVPPDMDAKGIFIKEIEEALLANTIDLAVHSLKDLPTEIDARFTLAAIPPRADARDVLLAPEWIQLHTLADGARVGTTSPRRKAQILAHRPDIQFVSIRGNIDTRLRKLAAGECDALVLAAAGVDRLGARLLAPVELDPAHPEFNRTPHMECITHADHDHLEEHPSAHEPAGSADWIRQRFDPEILCPAPGQGALAVEVNAANKEVIAAVSKLDHAPTRFAIEAERALLHGLGGGCSLPVGAYFAEGKLCATVTAPDGEQMTTCALAPRAGETAKQLGQRAAAQLIQQGARELLAELA
ncbi:MAG: hydroxymethylbilane synthase [Acidobacteria bacterium]|nr:hydroxymethylbilane synthase [Acidobacteriota bacterium]